MRARPCLRAKNTLNQISAFAGLVDSRDSFLTLNSQVENSKSTVEEDHFYPWDFAQTKSKYLL